MGKEVKKKLPVGNIGLSATVLGKEGGDNDANNNAINEKGGSAQPHTLWGMRASMASGDIFTSGLLPNAGALVCAKKLERRAGWWFVGEPGAREPHETTFGLPMDVLVKVIHAVWRVSFSKRMEFEGQGLRCLQWTCFP